MRPTKSRVILCMPRCRQFRPVEAAKEASLDPGDTDAVTIGLDMLEAMRLVDAEGMSQEAAARSMDVSTPTLCRILGQGRRLVAQALSSGKIINMEGGNIMYDTTMQGRHGQGCCHGHQNRHGQNTMQDSAAERPQQKRCACGGENSGHGKGQGRHGSGRCQGGIGKGPHGSGHCRAKDVDAESQSVAE